MFVFFINIIFKYLRCKDRQSKNKQGGFFLQNDGFFLQKLIIISFNQKKHQNISLRMKKQGKIK